MEELASELSLVHRLQRERGATAAWVSSSAPTLQPVLRPCSCGTGSLVADLRRRTDASLRRRADAASTADIASRLSKLREEADGAGTDVTTLARLCFVTLSGFSSLIKSILSSLKDVPGLLAATVNLKELFGQQRAFIVGIGSLPADSLAGLPPRAIVLLLALHDEQDVAQRALAETASTLVRPSSLRKHTSTHTSTPTA